MLVQVNELKAYMGGWNDYNDGAISDVLLGVQQELETWLNRPLEYIQIREIVQSDRQGFLYLSVTPVRKVISCGVTTASDLIDVPDNLVEPYVMVRDALLDEDARIVDRTTAYTTSFRPAAGGLWVNAPFTSYLVEYIGGYNYYTDEALKLAIKRVAAREVRRYYVDDASMNLGGLDNTEQGDTRLVGWTKEELTRLERYRRRVYL